MGTLEVNSGQIRDVISRKRCWDWTWLVKGTEEAKDGTWCWAYKQGNRLGKERGEERGTGLAKGGKDSGFHTLGCRQLPDATDSLS